MIIIFKYIIVKDNNKHYIKKVKIIEDRKFNAIVELKNGDIIIRAKNQLIDDYKTACIVRNEVQIRYDFKMKIFTDNGKFICANCKSTGRDARYFTLDHIKPLSAYKGDIRKDVKAWNYYWSEDNLQMLCKKCNTAKGRLSNRFNYKIDRYARKKNMRKQRLSYTNKASNKIGFDLATGKRNKRRVDGDTAIQIAKRDSRVLNLDLVLNKKRYKNNK